MVLNINEKEYTLEFICEVCGGEVVIPLKEKLDDYWIENRDKLRGMYIDCGICGVENFIEGIREV